jgi:ribonuclease I
MAEQNIDIECGNVKICNTNLNRFNFHNNECNLQRCQYCESVLLDENSLLRHEWTKHNTIGDVRKKHAFLEKIRSIEEQINLVEEGLLKPDNGKNLIRMFNTLNKKLLTERRKLFRKYKN